MHQRIYLDHNASTPVDPEVLKAMIVELEEGEGNPSSIHYQGRRSRRVLDESRAIVARYFKVKPHEIIFTSGGSEGAALLLQGTILDQAAGHAITSSVEHACVYQTLQEAKKKGWDVSFIPVHEKGSVNPEDIEKVIRPTTRLISLMAVNNETGVKTDIDAIAKIAQKANIVFIVDGVAWLGKEKVQIHPGISGAFFSGHKIHAPKGVGFCICRSSLKLRPLFIGGGQEFNRRPGTENLPGIAALAKAISLLENKQEIFTKHMRDLRDFLERELISTIPGLVINGRGDRVCNTTNLAFTGIDGESLVIQLDMEGLSVSLGSACASGAIEPSRVLLEMGIPLSLAKSSLRFSLSRMTTEEDIKRAIVIITRSVQRLRQMKE